MAHQKRSSPEEEEIWEEVAELELVRRTSLSISDAAWGPEGRAKAFVGALEDMATRVRLVWEESKLESNPLDSSVSSRLLRLSMFPDGTIPFVGDCLPKVYFDPLVGQEGGEFVRKDIREESRSMRYLGRDTSLTWAFVSISMKWGLTVPSWNHVPPGS